MINVIIVCGLNGAGKSTLGKALAEKLNYRFIDIEDIYFPKDDPNYMYLNPRPFEEILFQKMTTLFWRRLKEILIRI